MHVENIIHLPRRSNFTINHTFVNAGKVRHNMAERKEMFWKYS